MVLLPMQLHCVPGHSADDPLQAGLSQMDIRSPRARATAGEFEQPPACPGGRGNGLAAAGDPVLSNFALGLCSFVSYLFLEENTISKTSLGLWIVYLRVSLVAQQSWSIWCPRERKWAVSGQFLQRRGSLGLSVKCISSLTFILGHDTNS